MAAVTPADQLRSLVKEATPGPWEYFAGMPPWIEREIGVTGSVYAPEGRTPIAPKPTYSDARLIALAPRLAELVADMGDELAAAFDSVDQFAKETGVEMRCSREILARLAALFPEDSA